MRLNFCTRRKSTSEGRRTHSLEFFLGRRVGLLRGEYIYTIKRHVFCWCFWITAWFLFFYFYSQMMIRWKLIMKVTPTVTAAQEKGIKVVTKTPLTLSQNQKKSGAECCPECCPETSKIRHRCPKRNTTKQLFKKWIRCCSGSSIFSYFGKRRAI